jgi:hypothetical protein
MRRVRMPWMSAEPPADSNVLARITIAASSSMAPYDRVMPNTCPPAVSAA